ncbi:uncharacterized protein LOC114364057 [Ostrinia furnacalis]|uniref:uncharacterized protein LOC114364057 n=1 Tax=Ostrinia furnacalis TaxID=93504 RepID=UPI00103A3A51|nr:uncharacterized protein LOC114364057 [Ostrinia furnacalis]
MFCRISEERLKYIFHMQNHSSDSALRSAPLQEVENSVEISNQIAADETIRGEGGVVPGRVYLPNTFTGGPRYMKTKYMDAIALVNRLGTPSYFLTMTCNPKWPEIQQSIPQGQRLNPLICARVFNLKLAQLLKDLRTGAWFGRCMYIMHVIEFQKRGLPHAHICFRIEGGGPIQNFEIDQFVRADIPPPSEAGGRLRKAVLDHMIHGPCGPPHRTDLPCWDTEKMKCTRYFPKSETAVTYCDDRGFVHLRRDSKNQATIKFRNRDVTVSDLWVVPYNAALLLKYDCHINLLAYSARAIVKYLFKYMTKGPDESRVTVVPDSDKNNEIEQYVTKRYLGSCEATWRILEFDITAREPNVKQLAVHLEGQQSIFFKPGTEADAARRAHSDLITYFKRPLGEQFDNLTYLDFYERYIVHSRRPTTRNVEIFELSNNKFLTRRQRGELVSRLFWVAPNRGELFYLRLLLASQPCRSYDDLYKLGGPLCKTFQEAAKALGIADDEAEYEIAMQEASTFLTGPRLRSFFVLLAVNGVRVVSLWDKYRHLISQDFLQRLSDDAEKAYKLCLIQIDRLFRRHGTSLVEQGLPGVIDDSTEVGRERVEYNRDELNTFVSSWLPKLSPDQNLVFNYIHTLLSDSEFRNSNNTAIFIDGPAGTGKTLLLNVITAHARGNSGIVLCTASSGIAAQNYVGGITAHSMFKFPLNPVDDLGYWSITNGSQRAELVRQADVIIYDEAPMAHKYLIHLLDRSLRDLMNCNKIFGGKIVIFAGDFRQIPPVVVRAKSNSDIINCSVKSSPIWEQIKIFNLSTSQRNRDDPEYSDFLLKLGSNQLPVQTLKVNRSVLNLVDLTSHLSYVTDLNDLIDFVFSHVVIVEPDTCAGRAILTTHNQNVREINSIVLDRVESELLHFYSIDKVVSENTDEIFLGADALNKLQPKGVPEHDLKLKVGCVCMIIRNLSFSDRLVNGTKVIVVKTTPRIIIVRKPGETNEFLIPRILFKAPIEPDSPIEMTRRQFPLALCYAMTVHKSQGQTINRVGVDLRSDVFSHGQLYVALGRVQEKSDIKILVSRDKLIDNKLLLNNVVYPQLL